MRRSLEEVLLWGDPAASREPVAGALEQLVNTLDEDLRRLEAAGEDEAVTRRLVGVIETLGGGLVVASNGLVGAGLTPVTGGISVVGAAVSATAGTEMVSRGAAKALGS